MSLMPPRSDSPAEDQRWKTELIENRIQDPQGLTEFLLNQTSRTFALNIQVLPVGLRQQIRLAYLFCRMADTLEDDMDLSPAEKIPLLERFRNLFPPAHDWASSLTAFLSRLPMSWRTAERWDHLLVAHAGWVFPQLEKFPAGSVRAISDCVREMSDGMIRFTERQVRQGGGMVLIRTVKDLDEYCYYVAGTVGNMLCGLFNLHSPLIGKRRFASLQKLAVSFGLGLQLTNILKDVHEDRGRNVSFIPTEMLAEENLTTEAFLNEFGSEPTTRVMTRLLRKAQEHLRDALDYTCLLPRMEPRLRLFCLWPLFMAAETLVLIARHRGGSFQGDKLKISRTQVQAIVRKTALACWSNAWLLSMFRNTMQELDRALAALPDTRIAFTSNVPGNS